MTERPHHKTAYIDHQFVLLRDYIRFAKSEELETPEPQTTNHPEAALQLTTLAGKIVEGEISSHREIALVVLNLGGSFGGIGGATTEIGEAARQVYEAVTANRQHFIDDQQFPNT